ncbi:hypothetical protein AB1Y20_009789 [Prymnesium parvum]|uniref:Uncharacterized protein n=1 Tax=Prymnesium parvum TaxID=97485 RepID=A0AB34K4Y0_PRYPA
MREPVSQTAASHGGRSGSRSSSVDFRAAVTTTKSTPSSRSCCTSAAVRSETTPSPIVEEGRRRQSRRAPSGLCTTARCALPSRCTMRAP